MAHIISAYLDKPLTTEGLKKILNKSARMLRPHLDKFDTIAFRGLSGALVGPMLAMRLKKEMLAVRKGEDCHTSRKVEGNFSCERYIIVDDLVCSGGTVNTIRGWIDDSFQREVGHTPLCAGFLLYESSCKYKKLSDYSNSGISQFVEKNKDFFVKAFWVR
jgi:adenine/guanine phosphoribosyltransferase-like PRPP-binding protein